MMRRVLASLQLASLTLPIGAVVSVLSGHGSTSDKALVAPLALVIGLFFASFLVWVCEEVKTQV